MTLTNSLLYTDRHTHKQTLCCERKDPVKKPTVKNS